MKKAFTLIELVVAIALLAMVFAFTAAIFQVGISSYRTAAANAEIMQKLRAITDQLNADFRGLRPDAPLLMWFEDANGLRFDQIMFFADGDFQSIQWYDAATGEPTPTGGDEPVIGNVARIFYGQAQPDRSLLARRWHILTAGPNIINWPHDDMSDFDDSTGPYKLNDFYEHDWLSLIQWKTIDWGIHGDVIVDTCFSNSNRPLVDTGDPNTLHLLMCDGLGSFTIQWAYWDSSNELQWYPEHSHFVVNPFGIYFNVPGSITGWRDVLAGANRYDVYPEALKFTFRLFDSKGIIKDGRVFTHIVYLED
jgi:prepilin-type N-terminal cleavage/methylation domain-containing protein